MKTGSFVPVIVALAACLSVASHADSWLPGGPTRKPYKFGDLDCVATSEPKEEDSRYSRYEFKCSRGGQEVFRKPGRAAAEIVSDPNHRYLVGVSNHGLDPLRFWITDSTGRDIALNNGTGIEYCEQSISLIRVWHLHPPKIDLLIEDTQLIDVMVMGCDRKALSLREITPFGTPLSGPLEKKRAAWMKRWQREAAQLQRLFALENEKQDREASAALASKDVFVGCAARGDIDGMKRLIKNGLKPDLETYDGQTPLRAAVEGQQVEAVRFLLSVGAPVDKASKRGETPLNYASRHGNLAIVQDLLKAKADPNAAEMEWRWTPLMRAASQGHAEIVEALLKAGADPDYKDRDGKTATDHANAGGHKGLMPLLESAVNKK
ncbi:MAG: ankyrin repeat domain-containing protein [Bdellovibrionales bacterium]|nr:ankyrin repeat domain-containing protein [Bdellovibrionales bacterium]